MLNPDKNLYSVGPVGGVVIIARASALKGGMTRDKAMNLIAWLVVATGATPKEIAAELRAANMPTVPVAPTVAVAPVAPPVVAAPVIVAPVAVAPVPGPATPLPIPPKVEEAVKPFIGDVDKEEAAALAAAVEAASKELNAAAMNGKAVDMNGIQAAWDSAGG